MRLLGGLWYCRLCLRGKGLWIIPTKKLLRPQPHNLTSASTSLFLLKLMFKLYVSFHTYIPNDEQRQERLQQVVLGGYHECHRAGYHRRADCAGREFVY